MAPAETISGSAVNSMILDYYKKFGRKRDLEQYFSLSTAQNDLRDPSGTFWRRMKSENDSSDSGDKKSDSSQELCRISIRCSLPDPCSSQYHAKPTKPILTGPALLESLGINIKPLEEDKTKSESASPPIITEEATQTATQNSDDESMKSYDNHSQKSFDVLDTSMNKPLSPTSSITSQRKLEWDSLADVGYANESDRKTSASSLSTLERLALKQQYSNNDTKLDNVLEPPTAHSTPLDENEAKSKSKKGVGKKSTKILKKDVDYLEVNVPHSSENNPPQSINVNLTKHISFNVEKDGKVTVGDIQKDVSVSPEKSNIENVSPRVKIDKEMQTSLTKQKHSSAAKTVEISQKIPVLISLNTLRRHTRRKKLRIARKKMKSKKKVDKENIPVQEKSGEQLSEAESFEYMPGHVYNQKQQTANDRSGNTAGNKSSLESSGRFTTDSSKGSKHSFTKDLQKSIDILRAALHKGGDDTILRKKLIKQVCERLLKSRYRDDESSSDFLSGLSFNTRKQGPSERNHTTTSTSDNSGENAKRPKKSILRNDKFNAGAIASTSQSAPNLPSAANSEKLVSSNLLKNLTTSNTDSDLSKEKSSSDNVFAKTSSQDLYKKYLDALKREEAYKRHLKDKEMFLKQKLVCSDSAIKSPTRPDPKINNRLKDLINDLTRNNYDDGSGDASKLEGGPNSSRDYNQFIPIRSQRSHSVFTLSSGGNSDQNKKQNLKKRIQGDLKDLAKPGTSKEHYCCCPHHLKSRTCAVDSSVQVNIKRPCNDSSCAHKNITPRENASSPRGIELVESPRNIAKIIADDDAEDIKYVCLCNKKTLQDVPDNFLVFKCSRLSKGNQEESSSKSSNASCHSRNLSPRKNQNITNLPTAQCMRTKENPEPICELKTTTKSSQTNFLLKMLRRRSSDRSPIPSCCDSQKSSPIADTNPVVNTMPCVFEATRCLQTEISINPRIPEPSLSDINIVSDCANVVSEHCRKVSKLSLTDVFSRQSQNIDSNRNTGSSKSSGTSKDIDEVFEDDAVSSKGRIFEAKEKVSRGSDSDRSEKFTIPIQGTNMTLMVTIGSNDRKPKPDETIGQCVGTEKSKMIEQGTSLIEECSKGVQYNIERPGVIINEINSNNVEITQDKFKNPCTVNMCLTAEDTTFNTFPKTSPVNERKPFKRTNTDTDNFEKCAQQVSFDNFPKPLEIKSMTYSQSKCACGCFGSKEYCKDNCIEMVQSNQCEIHPIAQTASVEKETQCSDPIRSNSGGDNMENIAKNSNEVKNSYPNNKCSCGCTGTFSQCNRNCDERKKSLSIENKKRVETALCSCGCGFDEDKCNKNCDEINKSLITEQNLISPRCSCGCGGSVEHCKKDCERKKSLSTQYSGDKETYDKTCEERKERYTKEVGIQKDFSRSCSQTSRESSGNQNKPKSPDRKGQSDCSMPSTSNNQNDSAKTSDKNKISGSETEKETDPILELIQNITNKYSKNDIEKSKRKKCFKEIMTVLNYLLETEDSTDRTDDKCISSSSTTQVCEKPEKKTHCMPKKAEKSCQNTKSKPRITESSDCPQSTDMPATSSDSATCKVLNKIKKECERYHQKRCKIHSGKKCDISSSTSANCEQCRRVHHCPCRSHKCKCHKKYEKIQKKAVAYNLILQTSESISEDTVCKDQTRPLQNIVVKVPSQRKQCGNIPFKEMYAKIESRMPPCSPRETKPCRSKSLPNESEISSMEEFLRKSQACCTVREYLEQNRPDFIAKSSQRQDCLRIVSDSRNEDCSATPQLKMIVVHTPTCTGACNMYQCQRGAPVTCLTQSYDPCAQTVNNEVTRIANPHTVVLHPAACIQHDVLGCPLRAVQHAGWANMRAAKRDLLSVRLAQLSDVNDLNADEIRQLARDLGRYMRQKQPAPKFISERDMKKHSQDIYKSLPEVVQKKEEAKKENIKKTNLMMANIFKRNLQKKTLRGSVDISNYSPIIKI